MKSFASISRELYEAKFKLPKKHKELKVDSMKTGGKNYTITYSKMGKDIYAFVNNNETGPYKDLKDAEKSVKEFGNFIICKFVEADFLCFMSIQLLQEESRNK